MSAKKFIKMPYEKQSEELDLYMKNTRLILEDVVKKQEYLYEMQSFSMSAITALRKVLQKNGFISISDFEAEMLDLTEKNELLKETLLDINELEIINGEDMIQA